MAAKYIIGSLAASFAVAYVCDNIISDKKIFGGKFECFVMQEFTPLTFTV